MTASTKTGTPSKFKSLLRNHRSALLLTVLLLALLVVYGRMFLTKAVPARGDTLSPQVTKILQSANGQIPQFPMFGGRHFNHEAFVKMTPAQRRAMFEKRRAQFDAFFLAFAHASPAEQQAMVAAAKARFRAMRAKWAQRRADQNQNGQANNGHAPHGPHGRGNWQAHLPQMMANSLIHGSPEIRAARTGFFMAMHNSQ
ncbi:MAG: hypothetical protein HKL96_14085 [Phycisphaerales bacterium]|nr:hypothetical protein [Phycisphaerales bacterium]